MAVEAVWSGTRFADNVRNFITQIEYRTIETEADLDQVRRLRYEAYLKEGAISPNESRRMIDRYDNLDNVVNIGLFLEGRLVSAMRMHFLAKPGDLSPSVDVFPETLGPLLKAGKRMADPNKFVADYEAARRFPQLAYATTRLTMIAGAYFKAQLAIISPRLEHQAFYKRTFFASTICPPRAYPALSKPICLMLGDFEQDGEKIIQRFPFFASSEAEQEALFGKVKRPAAQGAVVAA